MSDHCIQTFPHRAASIALVTKLFQQLCYCWRLANVIHTEHLFHTACVNERLFCMEIRLELHLQILYLLDHSCITGLILRLKTFLTTLTGLRFLLLPDMGQTEKASIGLKNPKKLIVWLDPESHPQRQSQIWNGFSSGTTDWWEGK